MVNPLNPSRKPPILWNDSLDPRATGAAVFAELVKGLTRWASGAPRAKARTGRAGRPTLAASPAPARRPEIETPPEEAVGTVDQRAVEEQAGLAAREELREDTRRALGRAAATVRETLPDGDAARDALALLDTILGGGPGLVRQPPMAAQAVLAVLRRPNCSLAQLTKLIGKDPALAQTLLKHANSAFYAVPGSAPIVAISAAVQRIGTNGVNSTVMSSIIGGELSRPGAEFNKPAKQVWDHMVRTAPLARRLSRGFGVDPEAAFTLGLVHDVGKLVFFDQLGIMRREARREILLPDGFLSDALSCMHEPLGGLVALEWGMADDFSRAIANHHRRMIPEESDPASEVIFLSEQADLADIRGDVLDLDQVWEAGAMTGSLELTRTEFDRIAAEREEAENGPSLN